MKNKKILYLIGGIFLLLVLAFVTFNFLKRNSIYNCSYNEGFSTSGSGYYTLHNDQKDAKESNGLKCQKSVSIKCNDCEIIGFTVGYDYNNSKLLLLYSDKKKSVTIYDVLNKKVLKVVDNVKFNSKILQREKTDVALYNDNSLIGFIFPNVCKNSAQCETFFNLEKNEILTDNSKPEFHVFNSTTENYITGYSKGYKNNSIPVYKFVTSIKNGIIPAYANGGFNLYDIINEKYLTEFKHNRIYPVMNGYIFYKEAEYDGKDTRYKPDIIKYYDLNGKELFSNDNNKFNLYDIEVLQSINEELLVVIGTDKNDYKEKVKIIDNNGNVRADLSLTDKQIMNDLNSKLEEDKKYDKIVLQLPTFEMYDYFNNCYIGYSSDNYVISFKYRNFQYKVQSTVEYVIDMNTKNVIDKKTSLEKINY